ncbi:glycosyl hydrolase-related protein, partial [Acinetobacter baumannii]
TYVVYPHFFGHAEAGVSRAAYALNAPLRHAFLDRRAGENGVMPPLLECDDPNIVVETVKKAEEGSGIIVRVFERHNCR